MRSAAVIGTHILHVLPQRVLGYVFAGFLLLTAVRLVVDHASALGRSELTVGRAATLVVIGLVTGILAGCWASAGIVMVPAMIVLFGIPAVVAKGVVGGHRAHRRHGDVAQPHEAQHDLRVAAVVG